MNILDLNISEAAKLIATRQVSPVELAEGYLARIGEVDPQINSYITVTAELALQRAHQAEAEIQAGVYHGLHGIPLAYKDLFATRGIRTTAGARFTAENVPEEDAVVVQKLAAGGALCLGKLNMHEIALGVTNVNPHFGPCHNPWNLDLISGGSSGGSAAALAARLCLGALGSDTGGSIRIPAALCGVVGLKPTRGRVSLRGVTPLSWNLDHVGPLALCVRDAAILLQEMAGYDSKDPYSVDIPVDDYLGKLEGGVKGWRVALASDEYFSDATDPDVWAAVQAATCRRAPRISALMCLRACKKGLLTRPRNISWRAGRKRSYAIATPGSLMTMRSY